MSDMLESHEVVELLTTARVPRRYHKPDMGLATVGTAGVAMRDWVARGAIAELAEGGGRHFIGDKCEDEDFFYLTAKGFVLRAQPVKVIGITALANALYTEELAENLKDITYLFLDGFYDSHFKKPFDDGKVAELEWWIRRWLDAGNKLFTMSTSPIQDCHWYSRRFLHRVANLLVEVRR